MSASFLSQGTSITPSIVSRSQTLLHAQGLIACSKQAIRPCACKSVWLRETTCDVLLMQISVSFLPQVLPYNTAKSFADEIHAMETKRAPKESVIKSPGALQSTSEA